MSGRDFKIQIIQAIQPSEKAKDLIRMIDVLAEARAGVRGGPAARADYQFSAKVLCILFDPVKPSLYREAMPRARLLFQGIATDAEVEDRFRRAIAVHLVGEPTGWRPPTSSPRRAFRFPLPASRLRAMPDQEGLSALS